jgi:hypothetical protein
MQKQGIKGRGVDLDPRQRPGVPMEQPAHPRPGAQLPIEPQRSAYPVLRHGGRQKLPAVYGTAAPPRGLSGALRKWAYRWPDHWARHWLMLLVADRVDAWEYRLRGVSSRRVVVTSLVVVGAVTARRLSR